VLAILRRQQAERVELADPCPWVFTSNGKTPFSGWSQSKRRLDERCGVADWRIHDLRRTLVTGMNEELRISPHVVESVVNHVSGAARQGAAGVYNRALYLDERRRALQRWSRYVLHSVAKARKQVTAGDEDTNSDPG
jgi:integrase